jgi:hypothetical protein
MLRIEDTDRERSDPAMTRQIVAALEWIGIPGTRGRTCRASGWRAIASAPTSWSPPAAPTAASAPPTSSSRCAGEAERKAAPSATRAPASRCPPEEAARQTRRPAAPSSSAWRMPGGRSASPTSCAARWSSPADVLDDFVLLRSDGSPTYHLSVVVDDVDMGVTLRAARRGPPVEHAEARGALPGARRRGAAIRPPAADPRAGQEAAVEAHRRRLGGGVPRPGRASAGALQLPGAPRLVPRRGRRGPLPRGDDRALQRRGPERLGGGVRPRQAGCG